ncbi:MAG: DNA polymerase I [Gemmatimonadota bacterium]
MVEVPDKTRPRLFLIDGYALIYRAFFAMISRPLTTSKGENTSAAFGMTRFIRKILEEHAPDYLGVVMDAGAEARTKRYPEYKATREKMPDELRSSLPRIRALVEAFRIPILELDGEEADDVIGTLAKKAAERGIEAVIVSGDKDFYQLIGEGVALLNPGRGGSAGVEEEWVDERNASERLGVPPERVTDYLALIGDSSDNVPGAPGIGPKTALKLLDQYGDVDTILAHAGEVSGKRARTALEEHGDDVRLSKELVTIREDLPVELDLDQLKVVEPDRDRLRDLFVDLEFHSMVREIAAPEPETRKLEQSYETVAEAGGVEDVVARARRAGRAALSVLATGPDAMQSDVVGIALATEPGTAFYLPLRHRRQGELDLGGDARLNLPPLDAGGMKPLVELLEDGSLPKTGHDLKRSLLLLRRAGVALAGLDFDTMLASYVMDPGRRSQELDAVALELLGHRTMTLADLTGSGRSRTPVEECDVARVTRYASENADVALRLEARLREDLQRYALDRLYHEIEMPLIDVLAAMETVGIRIDTGFFGELSGRLDRDLALIEDDIYKEAGTEFNINSTPQLREVLFEKLELPVLKKTKTGPSTDASVLEELAAQGHRIPTLILEYRQLDKLRSTYVDALPALADQDGRIHTSFNQAVAATGRLSSSDPNLQNIPIRTQLGAEIRKGFVPADGYVFLAADYAQIELRILAHLSGDAAFAEPFKKGIDVHRQTAARVFDVPLEDVSPVLRERAKTINFATVYGIGPHALARQLGTSYQEAKQYIDQYFERFPGVRAYLDEQIRRAYDQGYVETISGRRRYIPEVKSKNYNIRQFGERAATNAPVQGSAADVIKLAMIAIQHDLAERGAGTRMLLQVHDELVFEVPEGEVDDARDLVKRRMEHAVEMGVPLEVALGVGANWLECK